MFNVFECFFLTKAGFFCQLSFEYDHYSRIIKINSASKERASSAPHLTETDQLLCSSQWQKALKVGFATADNVIEGLKLALSVEIKIIFL